MTALIMILVTLAFLWLLRHRIYCAFKGHQWHEGEDTLRSIHDSGGFYFGGYTWKCQRCGSQTEVGDAPPPNHSWDHRWCDPNADPFKWSGKEGKCFEAYRHLHPKGR